MSDTARCRKCGTEIPEARREEFGGVCPRCLAKFAAPALSEVEGASDVELSPPSAPLHEQKTEIPPLKAGDRFRGLEVIRLLGQGGMGMVYQARQVDLDRVVALKILSPKLSSDPEFAARFGREARALAKLSHPNIVQVYESGREGPLFYLVMEFVDGVSLRQLLQEGTMKPTEALRIVPQICEGLEYAHAQGVVHRDIKPENILIDRAGRVRIADFGLAKLGGEVREGTFQTETASVMGTPQYMAPEQSERMRDVDHRADIFSLGVVFYEMLTGELPVGHFLPPSQKVQVDVRLDEVVLKTLAKEQERRYQRAVDVKTAVDTIVRTPEEEVRRGEVRSAQEVRGTEEGTVRGAEGATVQPRTSRLAAWSLGLLLGGVGLIGVGFSLTQAANTAANVLAGLGVASLFASFLLSIVALFSILSSRGRLKGAGLAWSALIASVLFTLLMMRSGHEMETSVTTTRISPEEYRSWVAKAQQSDLAPKPESAKSIDDELERFYKFPVGTTWVYQHSEGRKIEMTVTRVEDDRVFIGTKEDPLGNDTYWTASGNSLITYGRAGLFFVFRKGSKEGDVWMGMSNGDKEFWATHMGVGEVKVPAGAYSGVVHTRLDLGDGCGMDWYLAPGVGPIRTDFQLIAGGKRESMELLEFREGK